MVYRGLTVKNCYQLPLISRAFKVVEGVTIFTKTDLCNVYHLVHIREGDAWNMAFEIQTRHYDYLVMLYYSH